MFFGFAFVSFYAAVGMSLFHGLYHDQFQNFDHFTNSAVAIAVLTTTENYPDILYPGESNHLYLWGY